MTEDQVKEIAGAWTRGPWEVRPCGQNLDICLPVAPGDQGVAVVATVFGGEADANLIAASPRLYKAVERALRHAENIGIDAKGSSYVNTLRAALANARGERP